jgi:hypothetical protein
MLHFHFSFIYQWHYINLAIDSIFKQNISLLKKFPIFVEPEVSLLCSQERSTGCCPEPDNVVVLYFFMTLFNIIQDIKLICHVLCMV